MENLYPFGATFKYLREARGLSLKEAASDIVSPQFLSQFEKGDKGISLENFAKSPGSAFTLATMSVTIFVISILPPILL